MEVGRNKAETGVGRLQTETSPIITLMKELCERKKKTLMLKSLLKQFKEDSLQSTCWKVYGTKGKKKQEAVPVVLVTSLHEVSVRGHFLIRLFYLIKKNSSRNVKVDRQTQSAGVPGEQEKDGQQLSK